MNNKSWSNYSEFFNTNSLIAGFTNKHFPHLPPNDRIEFANVLELDNEQLVKPKQIHSNFIVSVNQPGEILNVDGIISLRHDLVLSIQVADCIPIFIYDNRNEILGLVHAGWRGISKGIINKTVEKLSSFSSSLKNVKVILGPSIRQCCFEIGPEVAVLFDEKYMKGGQDDRAFMDLQSYVIDTLEHLGIYRGNVLDVNKCTCCSEEYHSFRRDGDKAGRMIAMIGFKNL